MADAGSYELLDLFWDERVNPITEQVPVFKRHMQGEVLELDEAEATRLVEAGSVAPEGERQKVELLAAQERFRVALANAPDDVRRSLADFDPAAEAEREVPVEELHVHHPAVAGFTNEGHPKYAASSHGEGGVGEGLNVDDPDEPSASTAQLDATQASLDDGGKDTRNARRTSAASQQRDTDAQTRRADLKAPAKQSE